MSKEKRELIDLMLETTWNQYEETDSRVDNLFNTNDVGLIDSSSDCKAFWTRITDLSMRLSDLSEMFKLLEELKDLEATEQMKQIPTGEGEPQWKN